MKTTIQTSKTNFNDLGKTDMIIVRRLLEIKEGTGTMLAPAILSNDAGMGMDKYEVYIPELNGDVIKSTGHFKSAVLKGGDKMGANVININGADWSFETDGQVAYEQSNSKDNEIHYKLTQYTMYKIYKRFKIRNFFLCMGVDIELFLDEERKNKMIKDLMSESTIVIDDNGEKVELNILGITLKPETLSAKVLHKKFLGEGRRVIFDIGTRNMQATIMQDGRRIEEDMNHYGYGEMVKGLLKYVNGAKINEVGRTYTKEELESYIQNGWLDGKNKKLDNVVKSYIKERYSKHIIELLQSVKADVYTKVLFVGGTSSKIFDVLKDSKVLNNYVDEIKIDENSLYTNVKSMQTLALLDFFKNKMVLNTEIKNAEKIKQILEG